MSIIAHWLSPPLEPLPRKEVPEGSLTDGESYLFLERRPVEDERVELAALVAGVYATQEREALLVYEPAAGS
jgi:hypothetical protein